MDRSYSWDQNVQDVREYLQELNPEDRVKFIKQCMDVYCWYCGHILCNGNCEKDW